MPTQPSPFRLIGAIAFLLISACGGGSGSSDGTFSDPANRDGIAKEDQVRIGVELQNAKTFATTTTANSLEPLLLKVALKNGDRKPLAGKVLNISSTLGVIDSEAGDVLTDENGLIEIEISVPTALPGSAGTITITYLEETEEAFFDVGLAPVRVGFSDSGGFVEGVIATTGETIASNGEALLRLEIVHDDGSSIGSNFSPLFNSDCISEEPAAASIDNVMYHDNGEIVALYSDISCVGQDTITANFADLPGHSAIQTITILPPQGEAISFVSAEFTSLTLQDSGNATSPDSTLIKFSVFDSSGQPASNIEVNFSLSASTGDVTLDRDFDLSNSDGEVEVALRAGSVPTVVRIVATVAGDSGEISAVSDSIAISGGRPVQNSFSISADILNPGGDSSDGVSVGISVSVADRFNSPVPDGTIVFFLTEYGQIDANCATTDGRCSVTWSSQAPRQPLFSSFLDDDGESALLHTIFNTNCPNNPKNSRGHPCPSFLGQPIGGRSTVMAYTSGDEDFIDANGNGLFDTGESFKDLPEVFLDHNEDLAFGNSATPGSCFPNCPATGGNEETFVDTNIDGTYNSGNGIYSGSLCSATSLNAGSCTRDAVGVSDNVVILSSGSKPYGAFYNTIGENATPKTSIQVGSSDVAFTFYASDLYNGALPNDTTLEFTSINCPFRENPTTSISNTNLAGPIAIPVVIQGATNEEKKSGEVRVTISSPVSSGFQATESFAIPCSVDACSTTPAPEFCSGG